MSHLGQFCLDVQFGTFFLDIDKKDKKAYNEEK